MSLALHAITAWPLTPHASPLTPEQEARYRTLIHQLRCLVCQNQTIADSNADLAKDLREQVRSQILSGKDDAAIRAYLTDRYGDFVLYKPPLSARTVVLWAGPFALLLLALAIAVRVVRRSRRGDPSPAPVDAERLRRLLDEEREG
jgi:cytochrome c-type biogenesis protein CcmH